MEGVHIHPKSTLMNLKRKMKTKWTKMMRTKRKRKRISV